VKKLTYKEVKERIEKEEGYKLLSKEYINSTTKLRVQCPKEHNYVVSLGNFTSGKRCPVCASENKGASQRLNIKKVKEFIKSKGYKLLSTYYKNANSKLLLECPKGHKFEMRFGNFQQGQRCSVCALEKSIKRCSDRKFTIKFVLEQTKKLAKGYECLSSKYINNYTNLKFICPKGHTFTATWNKFSKKHGTRCPICSRNNRGDKLRKFTPEMIQEIVSKEGYTLLSTEYISTTKPLKFKCPRGHIYKTSWGVFYYQGSRCKLCSYTKRRKFTSKSEYTNWYEYRDLVDIFSNRNFRDYYYDINPKKLERGQYNYHLDHIYPVSLGFKYKILPEILANPFNLQMLWWKDNIEKRSNTNLTTNDLFKGYVKYLYLKEKRNILIT
jgi:hypothetical protein